MIGNRMVGNDRHRLDPPGSMLHVDFSVSLWLAGHCTGRAVPGSNTCRWLLRPEGGRCHQLPREGYHRKPATRYETIANNA